MRGNDTHGVAGLARSFPPWAVSVVATFLVLIAYFLSARLGLALLTQPDGVAVFWPAAGVSAGLLIGLGPRARLPVVIGVGAATIAANLLGDRNIWSSIVFAFCNAFEAAVIALLIERYFGSPFELNQLRRVIGFIVAVILGCGVSGIGGMTGYLLFHPSTASAGTIWQHWFASDLIGIISVAPLLIGLVTVSRDAPSPKEVAEGVVGLAMLAGGSSLFLLLPYSPWDDVAIVSIFPLLLWLAARCKPIYAAAAGFIIAITIVWLTIWEIDFLGIDASLSIEYRIITAQVIILSCVLCALVLAALFSERRKHMSLLVESELRLQSALAAGQATAFDWDVYSGYSTRSENATQIVGLDLKNAATARSFLERIHPDDRPRFKACLSALRPTSPSYAVKFRYVDLMESKSGLRKPERPNSTNLDEWRT